MALGGGTFVLQNKELPGAYINFVSAASANPALADTYGANQNEQNAKSYAFQNHL